MFLLSSTRTQNWSRTRPGFWAESHCGTKPKRLCEGAGKGTVILTPFRCPALLGAVCMAALWSGTGCANRTKDMSHTVVLSCWGDTQEYTILSGLLKSFEAQNPGWHVEIQRTPYEDYITKLLTQSAGGFLPDVLFMGVDEALQFYPRGLLEPLDAYMAADKDFHLGDYYPQSLEPFRFKGKFYVIPRD